MVRIITLSRIGYNHPSQANWSWGVWKIDFIEEGKPYNMSLTVKEAFGGDSRLRRKVKELTGVEVLEVKGVWPEQSITGIRKIKDMESDEVMEHITAFLQK